MFEHAAESEDSAQTNQPKFESERFRRRTPKSLPQVLLLYPGFLSLIYSQENGIKFAEFSEKTETANYRPIIKK